MGKPAVNRRPLTLIGGLGALGPVATLAVTTPSAAGAQTRGQRLQLQHRPACGMSPKLCPTGGQVVRIR